MKKREIKKMIQGQRAIDGAGVHLVRVLGYDDVQEFDPFLMLDSFDSTDPADYTAGFPMHPHRGIETVTYLISGRIEHMDSLGNKGVIGSGESQWMTSGSGIMHQEMPKESDRMLGFQLWLNMPKSEKMAAPAYLGITQEQIPVMKQEKSTLRVLSGHFKETAGVKPKHIPATIYDISLEPGGSIEIPTNPDETVFIFMIEGSGSVNSQNVPGKTAVLFDKGDYIAVNALPEEDLRFIFFSGAPLHEPIAWGGPIVMNTREELNQAFSELRSGTFIKKK